MYTALSMYLPVMPVFDTVALMMHITLPNIQQLQQDGVVISVAKHSADI